MLELFPLAYIDPGTGSMLFTIAIGIIAALSFFFKKSILKLKFFFSGGKAGKDTDGKKNIVIFGESPRYYNVFKPLCDSLERRGIFCEYMARSEDDPMLKEEFEYIKTTLIGEGNRGFARLNMLNAYIVVATTPGLDVYQWKRSENVDWYVHIFHSVDDGTIYRMFGLDYYDAVLAPAAFAEPPMRKLEEIRSLQRKEFKVVGSTYMDGLERRISDNAEKPHHETTILLAPSWGESSILSRYGEDILSALITTGYRIIVRPHPQSKVSESELLSRLEAKFPSCDKLIWNYDNDNFHALNESDLMISDFSSVIFDFTLAFDKPVIYADTSFDTAPYDAAWLDKPAWTFEVLPQSGVQLKREHFDNIKEVIDNLLLNDNFAKARAEVRCEARPYAGEAAERMAAYLADKLESLKQTTEN